MKFLFKQFVVSISIILFFTPIVNSQSFSTTVGTSAFPSGGSVCKAIIVSGLVGNLNHDHGLQAVKLNINNPNVSKVEVSVVSPNGTSYDIISRFGTYTGANFTNTTISQINSPDTLNGGVAPFTGNFFPNGTGFDFCKINNNIQSGNGTWKVCVKSSFTGGVAGVFVDAQLTFGNNAPSAYGTGVASDNFLTPPYTCDLTDYSGWTSDCYTTTELAGTNIDAIDGIGDDNTSYVKVLPTKTTLNIDFSVANCSNNKGIQIVILQALDAGLTQFIKIPTVSGTNPFSPGIHSETINGMTPGTPVYILFDGWGGDVCEYKISNYSFANSTDLMAQVSPTSSCLGSNTSSQILTQYIPTASYSWTPTTGLSASNIYNPIATPLNTTKYVVTANDPLSGCIFKDSVLITVNPLPIVNAGNDVTICNGASTTLTAVSTTGSTGIKEFQNFTDVAIPDNSSTGATSSIAVSGINPSTYSTARINKVCMNINHPDIHDLSVKLTSPGGSTISLKNYTTIGTSGYGGNFINACFVVSGGIPLSYDSRGPLWSEYAPATGFNAISSGSAINGNWTLQVVDNFAGNIGTLTDWSMYFNNTPLYNWTPTTNLGTPTTASTTANPTSTTTYSVSEIDGNGCSSNTDNVVVTVNPSPTVTGTLAVCVGSTTQLTGSGTPASVSPWVSASPAIATVSSTGLVTGVSAGTSIITYTDDTGCSKTASVTVSAGATYTGTMSACVGGLTVSLSGASSAAVSNAWVSSNTSVATISFTGTAATVTAVSAGTTSITYTKSNGCAVTKTFTVNAAPTISGTLAICSGMTSQLTGSGTPDATTPWTSSSTTVATISSSGLVTAIASGSTTITYKEAGGCTKTATFTVGTVPSIITSTLSLCAGATSSAIVATGTPALVDPWISSNTSVATISSGGVVTGLSGGTTSITYTKTDGCSITFNYTINQPLIAGNLSTCIGGTTQLAGTGTPYAASPWKSSTTSVATVVSSTGLVTGVTAGTTTITYKDNNSCSTTASLTVVASNTISLTSAVGTDGQTVCSGASIVPITYVTGGSTGGSFSSLPSGITGSYNSGLPTISGSTTQTGSFPYTITLTGGCGTVTTSGVINILPQTTASIAPVTPFCVGGSTTLSATVNAPTTITSSFSNKTSQAIQNGGISSSSWAGTTGSFVSSDIPVTGLQSGWSLASVTLNITHPADDDIVAYLVDPCGNKMKLLQANGGLGKNFVNTTFSESAVTVIPVTQASAPFTNTYIPMGGASAWNTFRTTTKGCLTANGTWTLRVGDWFNSVSTAGTFNDWTINFNNPIATTYTWSPTTNMTGSTTLTPTVTPTSAGTFVYTLSTNNTANCSNSTTVSIVTTNPPTLPAFTGPTSLCVGENKTLANATSGGTWTSSNTSKVIINATTGQYSGLSAGTSTITYTVVAGGCTSTRDTVVTVNAYPLVSAITGPLTLCPSTSIQLLDATSSGVWSSGSVAVATINSSTGLVTGVAPGTSTINYTVTSNGCSTIVDTIVTVNSIPTVTVNDTTICNGASGKLRATPSVVGGSYSWNVGGTSSTNTQSPSSSTNYSVIYTLNGCASIADTGRITVNPIPTITFNSPVTCPGVSATLTATPSISGGAFLWGNGSAGSSIIVSPLITTTYGVVYTSSDGCSSLLSNGTVTVNPKPTIAAIGGTLSVCVTSTTPLTNSTPSGTWTSASPGIATIDPSTGIVTGVSQGTSVISYTVTSGGCTDSQTATVTVKALPNVPPITGTTTFCEAATTSLLNTTSGGIWTSASTSIATIDPSTGLVTGVSAGTSLITYTIVSNGCSDFQTTTVTVKAKPIVPLITGTTTVCEGATTTLLNATSGGTWTSASTGIATINSTTGEVSGVASGTSTISYTLTSNGCSESASTIVTVNPLPIVSAISGTLVICKTLTTSLSSSPAGGVWSSGSTGIATINASTGIATGITDGTSTINYTVTASGCSASSSAILKVSPDNSITLTSPPNTNPQTVCVNNLLKDITYSTTGATGVTFGNLPNGVNGSFNPVTGDILITGSPIVAGNYNYSINLTGGCGSVPVNGSGTIITGNTITLISSLGTDDQTGCVNTGITAVKYKTTGATGATFTGLPNGVVGNWLNDTITISGSTALNGLFHYAVNLTGGCGNVSKNGSIQINPTNTISLSSASGTDLQTKCINSAIDNITYSTTGATSVNVTGLPTGVNFTPSLNSVLISGTATVSGSFNYTVTTIGGCGPITTSGTINISPQNTVSLTSASGTDNQSICLGNSLTAITYSTTGAISSTVTGLPAGVIYTPGLNSILISGTPTASGGPITYTITLNGGCGVITTTGAISVTPTNTIALTSAFNSDNQTVCKNNSIANITYAITGTTSVLDSGLPTGVTGNISGGIYTLSGTPSVAGTFNYTLSLSGGCGTVSITGKIIVTATNSIVLTSAGGTDAQILCATDAIVPITYQITGNVTSANVTGLPTGISPSLVGNILTISGTTSIADGGTYIVSLVGGCPTADITGSITVNSNPILTITDPTAVCLPAHINLTLSAVTAGSSVGTTLTYWEDALCTTPIADQTDIAISKTYYIKSTLGSCFTSKPVNVAVNDCTCPVSLTVTNPAAVCAPGVVDLTTTFIEVGNGTISYYLSDGVTSLVSPNSISVGGIYYIKTLDASLCFDKKPVTVTINPLNTISLTSATSTETQSICIGNSIAPIVYSTSNANGVTATGLPNGVSPSFSSNTVTVSGTPSQAGIFNYTLTLTGGCGNIQAQGTLTVNPDNTISLSSAIGSDNSQKVCINQALTNITYLTSGATSGIASGLPSGITGNLAGNTFIIQGSTANVGVYPYSISFTGGCGTINALGTFEVKTGNTITLTSAIGTDTQTVYINTPILPITYAITGATGVTVRGLPSGINQSFNGNTLTISGTPTVAGLFPDTIDLIGGCGNGRLIRWIKVLPANTAILNSGSVSQTICVNNPISTIVYDITGFTNADFSSLPSGVTGLINSTTVTISGTPNFSGSGTYNIQLTGGSGPLSLPITLTVNPLNAVNLTSGSTTNNQSVCVNTPISTITYSTLGATNTLFTGLPAGLIPDFTGGIASISGTPTLAGNYPYVVTLTGGCGNVIVNDTIHVLPNKTISLSSSFGTDNQSICLNSGIATIKYAVKGAKNFVVNGLPQEVSANFNLTLDTITISGTATLDGIFNYTVNLTDGCGNASNGGIILVKPNNTAVLTSVLSSENQSICVNTPITNITYNVTGASGVVFSGFPSGIATNFTANVITISGSTSLVGLNTPSIILTGGCGVVSKTVRIDVVTGNTLVLSTNNNVQTPCVNSSITDITYVSTGATSINVTGLPAGLIVTQGVNSVTISGTPTVTGLSTYSVETVGGCGVVTLTGTIDVKAINSIQLTSTVNSDNQSSCINTQILEDITYSTTGATNVTYSNLPTGLSGTWLNNVFTITGTPIQAGNFLYTLNLVGGCGTVSTQGRVNIIDINKIDLTSAPGTDVQTVCQNSQLTDIVFTSIGANNVTMTGNYPNGVTNNYANGVYTIYGTPTQSGQFTYTLTLVGGCGNVSTTKTITVTPTNTILLSSIPALASQSVCINSAITNIVYDITGASGVTLSSVPANSGLIASIVGSTVVVSGTPTVSGNYLYTISLSGGCGNISTQFNLTVKANNIINLTSANSTKNQVVCEGTPLTNITYSTVGATSSTVSGLPPGVNKTLGANSVTISGTPTTPSGTGNYTYTISLLGGCGNVSISDNIKVNKKASITSLNFTGGGDNPEICLNGTVSLLFMSSNTTGVTFTGLPSNLPGDYMQVATSGLVDIIGSPNSVGSFPYKITTEGNCPGNSISGVIKVNANPTINPITDQVICEGLPLTLNAISNASIITWDNGVVNNVPFTPVGTNYKVIADNGKCKDSISVNVTVNPKPTKPNVTPSVSYCQDEQNVPYLTSTPTGTIIGVPVWYNSTGVEIAAPSQNTKVVLNTFYTVAQKSSDGCLSDTARINVSVKPKVTPIFAAADLSVCQGKENPVLPEITINTPSVKGTWSYVSTAAAGPVQTKFTPKNVNGTCVTDTTIIIEIHPLPVANFTVSPKEIWNSNPAVLMTNTSSGAVDYGWDFGDDESDDVVNPTHIYADSCKGDYFIELIAISEFGCISSKVQKINIKEDVIYYIPNSFTPNNGDHLNNVFHPIFNSGIALDHFSFTIFNRWGVRVFQTNDHLIGWDGKIDGIDAMVGSYTWRVEYKESTSEIIHQEVGLLNLLR